MNSLDPKRDFRRCRDLNINLVVGWRTRRSSTAWACAATPGPTFSIGGARASSIRAITLVGVQGLIVVNRVGWLGSQGVLGSIFFRVGEPGSRLLERVHESLPRFAKSRAPTPSRGSGEDPAVAYFRSDGPWIKIGRVLAFPLTGVLRRSLGQGCRDHCDKDPESASQFSTARPGTRLNSRSLSVTSVASIASAWAAIQVSLAPIGVPLSSRPARTLA